MLLLPPVAPEVETYWLGLIVKVSGIMAVLWAVLTYALTPLLDRKVLGILVRNKYSTKAILRKMFVEEIAEYERLRTLVESTNNQLILLQESMRINAIQLNRIPTLDTTIQRQSDAIERLTTVLERVEEAQQDHNRELGELRGEIHRSWSHGRGKDV